MDRPRKGNGFDGEKTRARPPAGDKGEATSRRQERGRKSARPREGNKGKGSVVDRGKGCDGGGVHEQKFFINF